ncbi:MAG: 2-C-methyl-D-erythritol 2,4-cyclodiphosphate synthase [bacterium]
MIRTGIGIDSHQFTKNKKLILAGKLIPDNFGLKANSDGDVIYHSLCNAIGTAIGHGSLSLYSDDMCKNGITDSSKYLLHIFNIAKKKGYKINNISISIECKTPKIESHVIDFKKNIAKILETNVDNIGICATSGEGLTDFGKGKGIQVISIVTLI